MKKIDFKKIWAKITHKKVEVIEEEPKPLNKKIVLSDDNSTLMIGDYEFIVLAKSEKTGDLHLLLKGIWDKSEWGITNHFRTSKVFTKLEEFAKLIEEIIGEDNLIEHSVDLTSNDGLACYGKTNAKASLLTTPLYRKFVSKIDCYTVDSAWWLVTPYSTPRHYNADWVEGVGKNGEIFGKFRKFVRLGIRPYIVVDGKVAGVDLYRL